MRCQADNIPHFDGNPKHLRFNVVCENFILSFLNPNNQRDPMNICIDVKLLRKLKDKATDLRWWKQINTLGTN